METNIDWFWDLIGTDSVNQAAGKAGENQSTLSRQIASKRITPNMAIALARGYGVSPCGVLINAGYLTEDEVAAYGIERTLGRASDEALVEEIMKRLKRADSEHPRTPSVYDQHPYFVVDDPDLDGLAAKHDEEPLEEGDLP